MKLGFVLASSFRENMFENNSHLHLDNPRTWTDTPFESE